MLLRTYLNLTQESQRKAVGIMFDGRNFTEPIHFLRAAPPAVSGIYVILIRDDNWSPRNFRPLYFGEARILSTRVNTQHERYSDWCRSTAGVENLFVAFHWMMGRTEEERKASEGELIAHFQPECNKEHKKASALYQALLRTQPTTQHAVLYRRSSPPVGRMASHFAAAKRFKY